MTSEKPSSLIDHAVGVCISLLIGAVALYAAVKVIETIWAVLLLALGVVTLVVLVATIVRSRNNNW